ncbi:hypothetical protein [Paucidesulfovibrio longus]|uniref:hypothetical protein n=1 Tax=Paucidesulfovibrio longus TaxID=889 RepID=UPI0003B66895|nr:hypothetical protein [Paucidesulfovibrio longus]
MKAGYFISLLVCGLLLFSAGGCGEQRDLAALFPENIAGAERTEFLLGEDALRAVDKLHGKSIQARDAAVAVYGAGHPPAAQVWVSTASNGAAAREQLAVMVNRMLTGKATPFGKPAEERRAGVDLYRTEGLGMVHLIWSRDELVWWLAVLPGQEEAYLKVFLEPGEK